MFDVHLFTIRSAEYNLCSNFVSIRAKKSIFNPLLPYGKSAVPLPGLTFYFDRAAHGFDNIVGDRQSQSGAG